MLMMIVITCIVVLNSRLDFFDPSLFGVETRFTSLEPREFVLIDCV